VRTCKVLTALRPAKIKAEAEDYCLLIEALRIFKFCRACVVIITISGLSRSHAKANQNPLYTLPFTCTHHICAQYARSVSSEGENFNSSIRWVVCLFPGRTPLRPATAIKRDRPAEIPVGVTVFVLLITTVN
jgi:hypothetical protein